MLHEFPLAWHHAWRIRRKAGRTWLVASASGATWCRFGGGGVGLIPAGSGTEPPFLAREDGFCQHGGDGGRDGP